MITFSIHKKQNKEEKVYSERPKQHAQWHILGILQTVSVVDVHTLHSRTVWNLQRGETMGKVRLWRYKIISVTGHSRHVRAKTEMPLEIHYIQVSLWPKTRGKTPTETPFLAGVSLPNPTPGLPGCGETLAVFIHQKMALARQSATACTENLGFLRLIYTASCR